MLVVFSKDDFSRTCAIDPEDAEATCLALRTKGGELRGSFEAEPADERIEAIQALRDAMHSTCVRTSRLGVTAVMSDELAAKLIVDSRNCSLHLAGPPLLGEPRIDAGIP